MYSVGVMVSTVFKLFKVFMVFYVVFYHQAGITVTNRMPGMGQHYSDNSAPMKSAWMKVLGLIVYLM